MAFAHDLLARTGVAVAPGSTSTPSTAAAPPVQLRRPGRRHRGGAGAAVHSAPSSEVSPQPRGSGDRGHVRRHQQAIRARAAALRVRADEIRDEATGRPGRASRTRVAWRGSRRRHPAPARPPPSLGVEPQRPRSHDDAAEALDHAKRRARVEQGPISSSLWCPSRSPTSQTTCSGRGSMTRPDPGVRENPAGDPHLLITGSGHRRPERPMPPSPYGGFAFGATDVASKDSAARHWATRLPPERPYDLNYIWIHSYRRPLSKKPTNKYPRRSRGRKWRNGQKPRDLTASCGSSPSGWEADAIAIRGRARRRLRHGRARTSGWDWRWGPRSGPGSR